MKLNTTSAMGGVALLFGLLAASVRADILYVANEGNDTIAKFSSTGSNIGSVSVDTQTTFPAPFGLAFNAAGNLFVAYSNSNEIHEFSSGLSDLGPFARSPPSDPSAPPGINGPQGLAFDSAGNLYVANAADSTIEKFTSGGVRSLFANTGLNTPRGLAFDSSGNLYAANGANNTIEKFSSTGTDLGIFASSRNLSNPFGLAFDRTGNLYVASLDGNRIEKFSSTGTDLGIFAITGLNSPEGLAFDSTGNLYAANQGNSTIEKFSSTGTDLGHFGSSGISAPTFLAFTNDAGNPLPLPAVPEPATWAAALLVTLACGIHLARRRPVRR